MLAWVLDASGGALLLSALLAVLYELGALLGGPGAPPTISSIVQRVTRTNEPLSVLIFWVIMTGLAVLGFHFLGVI